MVTDDERREVAERLRGLPDDSTYPDLIGAIADHDGWYTAADAADRLADLIEPEPERTYHPERIGTAYRSALMCSACKYPLDEVTVYCPHCGARLEGVSHGN